MAFRQPSFRMAPALKGQTVLHAMVWLRGRWYSTRPERAVVVVATLLQDALFEGGYGAMRRSLGRLAVATSLPRHIEIGNARRVLALELAVIVDG